MTDPEQWRRIKSLMFAAGELQGAERRKYLEANCATSEERAEVEELLSGGAPTEFMKMPALGSSADAGLRHGQRLGRYEIQAALGKGGGGAVYRALDTTLRRPVAIKVLAGEEALSQERFAREAEAASALNHPNIVTVYEIGAEDGVHFIAMEHIAGKSLYDHIRKEGLSLEQFFPWAIQISDGLASAHAAGIVHRDIKPGNVMITDRGVAKIVDFGLAKAIPTADDKQHWETITRTGTVAGTCSYMAPEQAEAKAVDARTDIFSLGCVFHEMLTGQRAFAGESPLSTIGRILHKDPIPVRELAPDCPEGLAVLVSLCLRKRPEERWQSAADLKLMLEQLQREWQAGPGEEKRQRRGSAWRVVGALAAGCVLTAAVFFWLRPAPPAPADAQITALTLDGGLTTSPSLSADGRMLAYASDRAGEGNLDIWVQQVGGRAPIRVTFDPADEKDPDLSSDGTQVVFRSEKDGGGIYVMPALGGQPVLLAQGGRNPRFSPDGRSVAYWTGQEGANFRAGTAHAFLIPSGGGQPQPLAGDMAAAAHPVWSPDGSRLLVLGRKQASVTAEPLADWWVVTTANSGGAAPTGVIKSLIAKPRTLFFPAWQSTFIPLTWDRHNRVLFTAQHADALNLWAVEIDPKTGHSGGKPIRITEGAGSETQASMAPSAADPTMAFSSMRLQFDVWGFPLDIEQAVRRGGVTRITEDLASESYPSLSRDGSLMAYESTRGSTFLLELRDLRAGKTASLLTPNGSPIPRLSGDGTWIVFGEYPGNISRISARGGAVEKLCDRCGTPVSVSYDGSRILLEPTDSEDVRELDAASRQITTLVSGKGPLFNAERSNDGKWVVFQSSAARPNSQIFVAKLEGGKAEPPEKWIAVTEADAAYRAPHWSPGGSVVYFLSDRDGFRCLWARKLDAAKAPAGPLIAVEHFHHARRSLQHISRFDASTLAVGGDMVVLVLGELTGNLWMRREKTQ